MDRAIRARLTGDARNHDGSQRCGAVDRSREAETSNREGMSMAIGYDSPLYVLPFDHRATFSKTMFGWEGPLTPEQTAQIAAVKQVIYDAFKAAVAGGVPKERAGILVDEQFGAAILRDASKQGFITACPAEKSGQDEFDFEYGAGLRPPHRGIQPDLLQGAGALQPGGGQGAESAPGRPPEAVVGLPARERQAVHVRAARAPRAGPAAAPRRRQEGVRPPVAPRADGPGHPRAAGRRRRGGRLEDRGHRTEGGLPEGRRRRPAAAAATRSAASSWAAGRTTRRCGSG